MSRQSIIVINSDNVYSFLLFVSGECPCFDGYWSRYIGTSVQFTKRVRRLCALYLSLLNQVIGSKTAYFLVFIRVHEMYAIFVICRRFMHFCLNRIKLTRVSSRN
jgi:hypothetical protein